MKNIYPKILFMMFIFFSCESSNLVDPSTTISYKIEEDAHVKLEVENSYNTIIKTLVDEEQSAGSYQVQFDAQNLAEGVYLYTIEANGVHSDYYFIETKHLLLAK